jgi:hypothetical protein
MPAEYSYTNALVSSPCDQTIPVRMKSLFFAFAFVPASFAQFDSLIQMPAVTTDACANAITTNIDKAYLGPCGMNATTVNKVPTYFASEAAATTFYDKTCSATCLNAVNEAMTIAEASCTSSDQKLARRVSARVIRAAFDVQCVKLDGAYCNVKLEQAAKNATKTPVVMDKTDPKAKHLCSPCLKKQIEMSAQLARETGDLLGLPVSGQDQAAKAVSTLLDVCPAGSTDAGSSTFSYITNPISSSFRAVVAPVLAALIVAVNLI